MKGKVSAIVLAGGKGTRLAAGKPSPKPKVLYEIGEHPIIFYTLDLLKKSDIEDVVIVVGYKAAEVEKVLGETYKFAKQPKQLGTGHGVNLGLKKVGPNSDHVIVLNGDDSAFHDPKTVKDVLKKHFQEKSAITFVSLIMKKPFGLGRVVRKNGQILKVVEEKAATREERKIKEVNDGIYVFERFWLEKNVVKIKKSNSGEYRLTDLIGIAIKNNEKVGVFRLTGSDQWFGVNTPEELEIADRKMREKHKDANKKDNRIAALIGIKNGK